MTIFDSCCSHIICQNLTTVSSVGPDIIVIERYCTMIIDSDLARLCRLLSCWGIPVIITHLNGNYLESVVAVLTSMNEALI